MGVSLRRSLFEEFWDSHLHIAILIHICRSEYIYIYTFIRRYNGISPGRTPWLSGHYLHFDRCCSIHSVMLLQWAPKKKTNKKTYVQYVFSPVWNDIQLIHDTMNDLLSIFHLVKSLLLQTFMYAHDGMENVYARISIYIYICIHMHR